LDRETARIYEEKAALWRSMRRPQTWALDRIEAMGQSLGAGARVADLGCGPAWYAAAMAGHGLRPVALDVSRAMLRRGVVAAAAVPKLQADLAALPFAREVFDGAVAVNCLVHLSLEELPVALAQIHASLRVGARFGCTVPELKEDAGEAKGVSYRSSSDDPFEGRLFTAFRRDRMRAIVEAAGFRDVSLETMAGDFFVWIGAERDRTLPDYVRPGLRVLVCGLNPSLYSADSGIPYGRPGNRFWAAANASGVTSADRDPWHALREGVGFSDFVKRATGSAAELRAEEYEAGRERLADTVRTYEPEVVCFAGLAGYRRTIDRKATPGWIEGGFAGRPAYLMPSPSGRNAHATPDDLAKHLAAVAARVGTLSAASRSGR
jgi:TDG/mug DNA glycosylase family protein